VRLFLFDIDGTILTARGTGRAALGRALQATYGTAGAIDRYDFRGKTDPRIVSDLMEAAGIPAATVAARLATCFDVYVRELAALLADGARVQLLPGVDGVVRALAASPRAVLGLLTGNIEAGARLKLAPTGLSPLFRLGAFGSDDADRRRLPAIACERARALVGRRFAFDRVTIIGDTPLDVDCARACGARAVVVATGQHAADELAACTPDLLFADLSDVRSVVAALLPDEP
jgi:phosphoglycolate phosphatase